MVSVKIDVPLRGVGSHVKGRRDAPGNVFQRALILRAWMLVLPIVMKVISLFIDQVETPEGLVEVWVVTFGFDILVDHMYMLHAPLCSVLGRLAISNAMLQFNNALKLLSAHHSVISSIRCNGLRIDDLLVLEHCHLVCVDNNIVPLTSIFNEL